MDAQGTLSARGPAEIFFIGDTACLDGLTKPDRTACPKETGCTPELCCEQVVFPETCKGILCENFPNGYLLSEDIVCENFPVVCNIDTCCAPDKFCGDNYRQSDADTFCVDGLKKNDDTPYALFLSEHVPKRYVASKFTGSNAKTSSRSKCSPYIHVAYDHL